MNKSESKKMWDKYHALKDKADRALAKLSDFAGELGYWHLADGFDDDMNENYYILEKILEEQFGPNPEHDEDEEGAEEEKEGSKNG